MFGEVLVIAFVIVLLGDVVSKGRVSAVLRGTTAGAARTAAAAGRAATSTALDASRAGRGTKAAVAGARDGIRGELARLPAAARDGRAAAEQGRRDAQDPVKGARPGWLGRSFDRAPTVVINVTGDRVHVTDDRTPATPDPAPAPKPARAGKKPDPAAAPATGTTTTGGTPVTTAAATPRPAPGHGAGTAPAGNRPSVRVESLPGFIAAVRGAADLVREISEQATANLKLAGGAQAGLDDAITVLETVAKTAHTTYNPLVEAADATPQGAEGVTVGQAKTE